MLLLFQTSRPDTIFRGSKCPSMLVNEIFSGFRVPAGSQNDPLERHFPPKNFWAKKVFDRKNFWTKNFSAEKVLGRKYFLPKTKIHPKNFNSKKFFTQKIFNQKIFNQKIFTQIVRLSFVDLRWAQLYVSLVYNNHCLFEDPGFAGFHRLSTESPGFCLFVTCNKPSNSDWYWKRVDSIKIRWVKKNSHCPHHECIGTIAT